MSIIIDWDLLCFDFMSLLAMHWNILSWLHIYLSQAYRYILMELRLFVAYDLSQVSRSQWANIQSTVWVSICKSMKGISLINVVLTQHLSKGSENPSCIKGMAFLGKEQYNQDPELSFICAASSSNQHYLSWNVFTSVFKINDQVHNCMGFSKCRAKYEATVSCAG